ncbi:tRNA glutamyl-Q(34) synthetase GluQRS [Fluviibacterium sp. DFM31]|uniref:tRNA glutamyl-Q(34) synthetase GluQRS n=1 Tax=Meridianimarinicoccus marinus TaxID=3231483 RepID=A0ABV3L3C3_9RHOB
MRTRFAPSPTGPLHLGHAFSALVADDLAQAVGGTFLLRIEDIDQSRARPEWEAQIYDDLRWLGLDWPEPVMRQSDRMDAYGQALDHLWAAGLLYPCACTRRDIAEALSAPQEGAPAFGPDGPIYPGTCRPVTAPGGPRPRDAVLRLNMSAALAHLGASDWSFTETGINAGPTRVASDHLLTHVGDVVLARRGMGTSYHLSVVVDDADQGITQVVRGVDLAEATAFHIVLQDLLGLPRPVYHHHCLIRDAKGKRLAKRDDARAIALYRAEGRTPADIRRMVGL